MQHIPSLIEFALGVSTSVESTPAWLAVLMPIVAGVVAWALSIEKRLWSSSQLHRVSTKRADDLELDSRQHGEKLQVHNDVLIQLKADLSYIRQGIDELKRTAH